LVRRALLEELQAGYGLATGSTLSAAPPRTRAEFRFGVFDDEEFNERPENDEQADEANAATVAAKAQTALFLQERLESLRADVLGALASRAEDAATARTATTGAATVASERQLLDDALGGLAG